MLWHGTLPITASLPALAMIDECECKFCSAFDVCSLFFVCVALLLTCPDGHLQVHDDEASLWTHHVERFGH